MKTLTPCYKHVFSVLHEFGRYICKFPSQAFMVMDDVNFLFMSEFSLVLRNHHC